MVWGWGGRARGMEIERRDKGEGTREFREEVGQGGGVARSCTR